MASNQIVCTYCGRPNPETFDHVPPACLFGDPRPSNLITVPCCTKCNQDASKDDEYFKTMLMLRHDVWGKPVASKSIESVYRALANPKKRGMLRALTRRMQRVPVHTPSGLYIGDVGTYHVDLRRLGMVADRTVKGLFYREVGHRLPDTHDVRSFQESGLTDIKLDVRNKLQEIVAALRTKPLQVIGDNVFQYQYQTTAEDINTSAWLLAFFGTVCFLSLSVPKNSEVAAT